MCRIDCNWYKCHLNFGGINLISFSKIEKLIWSCKFFFNSLEFKFRSLLIFDSFKEFIIMEETEKQKQRGGARPGSGRKPRFPGGSEMIRIPSLMKAKVIAFIDVFVTKNTYFVRTV